jgi:hypothetical protein
MRELAIRERAPHIRAWVILHFSKISLDVHSSRESREQAINHTDPNNVRLEFAVKGR